MNAGEVMRHCLRHWRLHTDQVIPRCCLSGWESDLLVIRRSGWVEEVEIKISTSDFRAEFRAKADKHLQFQRGRKHQVFKDWRQPNAGFRLGNEDVTQDPTLFSEPDEYSVAHQRWYVLRPQIIRRFWFAMPTDLARKLLSEVPADYGVLAVGAYNEVLRPPTNLKSARKLTDAERIHALNSTYTRFWNMLLAQEASELRLELVR